MLFRRLLQCVLIAVAAAGVSLPAQAAMVGTAQMQSGGSAAVLTDAAAQRDWIVQRLIEGGVGEPLAHKRVAAMTDDQVAQVHQRVDDMPAGASTGEILIIIGLILVITELMGYTDIIPSWPAE